VLTGFQPGAIDRYPNANGPPAAEAFHRSRLPVTGFFRNTRRLEATATGEIEKHIFNPNQNSFAHIPLPYQRRPQAPDFEIFSVYHL
jgi:hypothetical protein